MRRSTAIKSFHPSFQARLEELEWIKIIGRAKRDESFIGTTSRTKLNDLLSDSVWPLHFLKRALFQVFQLFLVFQDFQDFQVFQVNPFCHFHLLSIHSYTAVRLYFSFQCQIFTCCQWRTHSALLLRASEVLPSASGPQINWDFECVLRTNVFPLGFGGKGLGVTGAQTMQGFQGAGSSSRNTTSYLHQ